MVPVTVYEVVAAGVAVTVAPVVALKPVDGDHEYVVAPEAVRDVLTPAHTAASPPALVVGEVLTVTRTGSVDVQPCAFVPVTV